MPGDRHSRTTCTKLLVHGVNTTLRLQQLQSLGARSTESMRQCPEFQAQQLAPSVPAQWVHVVIVDYFAVPIGNTTNSKPVFSIIGLDEIGDPIQHADTYVLFDALIAKFQKSMNAPQAKNLKVMILSHKAGHTELQPGSVQDVQHYEHDQLATIAAEVQVEDCSDAIVEI